MNDPSTELVHTEDCGQVSINISKPGITKGQHWHNSKWELFIVVAGHGLIQERNINTGKMVEFEVSGGKIEAIILICILRDSGLNEYHIIYMLVNMQKIRKVSTGI